MFFAFKLGLQDNSFGFAMYWVCINCAYTQSEPTANPHLLGTRLGGDPNEIRRMSYLLIVKKVKEINFLL